MADITKCRDKRCPSRTLCYRFTAKADEYRQSYWAKSPRKPHAVRCEEFWSNDGIPDPMDDSVHKVNCWCNAMALPHKRNKICGDYSKKMKEADHG